MKPVTPPVDPHPFVDGDISDQLGHKQCARCPFTDARADVHTMPELTADTAAVSARILGEHEVND